jgi:hypothetical protein
MTQIDAKISFLQQGVKALADSHRDFQAEMTDFMSFVAEGLSDHEERIAAIEKRIS